MVNIPSTIKKLKRYPSNKTYQRIIGSTIFSTKVKLLLEIPAASHPLI
jgi:hypothetical protein